MASTTANLVLCLVLISSFLSLLPVNALLPVLLPRNPRHPRNTLPINPPKSRNTLPIDPPKSRSKRCSYDAIYQFGDSISDTGNYIVESVQAANSTFAHLPYGQSMNGPTGRCSDGLLMIDYIARALGIPLPKPYLGFLGDFTRGANFAVAGSTALDTSTLRRHGILSPLTNSSLNQQLRWFEDISSRCPDCKIASSLFILGTIGGNDYNYAFFQGKSIDEVKTLVPQVVSTIKSVVERLIVFGATRIVVPGNFPIGCMPAYLTAFEVNDYDSYDESGCLKDLNEFAMYHNHYLEKALKELRTSHPHLIVLYADYYNAFKWIFTQSRELGFNPSLIQNACCGTGGFYNFDFSRMCGTNEDIQVCANPDKQISWDGIHPTQKAYQYMAQWLLKDLRLPRQCV